MQLQPKLNVQVRASYVAACHVTRRCTASTRFRLSHSWLKMPCDDISVGHVTLCKQFRHRTARLCRVEEARSASPQCSNGRCPVWIRKRQVAAWRMEIARFVLAQSVGTCPNAAVLTDAQLVARGSVRMALSCNAVDVRHALGTMFQTVRVLRPHSHCLRPKIIHEDHHD